jgi:hypothetical protein
MDDFYQEIVKKEIDGKLAAIHEYDGMLWKLRIGFLSLYFAGWGLLFTTFMKIGMTDKLIVSFNVILFTLAAITLVICTGGWIIDLNISRRKYRVINALNSLYSEIFKVKDINYLQSSKLAQYIQASGSRSDDLYSECDGYKKELNVLWYVYGLPVLVMIIGLALLMVL